MARSCLHILDGDRSGGAIGVKRRDTQTTRRQARYTGEWVLYRKKLITIELKSRHGQCNRSQRAAREHILAAGGVWWVARSALAAMWALARSGVRFREIERSDGTIERWQQPKLPPWEVPKRDPHERRPRAPDVAAQRAAARKRWRERRAGRARESTKLDGDQERKEAAQ